jgi:two-component system invasion response regulator UvrY
LSSTPAPVWYGRGVTASVDASPRILITDDHAVVRHGIRQILADQLGGAGFGEAGSGAELARKLASEPWDVLILDISLPDKNGLDLLKEVRVTYPRLPVLMVSVHPEEAYAVRALKAGAAGYLTKDAAPAELVVAVRRILAGGRYVTSSLAERLAAMLDQDDRPIAERLSDREYQVLCRIGAGRTISEIGEELRLSVKTVSTYRARLLEKLALSTTAELTRFAIENHLV